MNTKHYLATILALAFSLSASAQTVYYEDAKSVGDFPETMAEHSSYVVSFNRTTKQPNWLSYSITKKQVSLSNKQAPAKAVYAVDPVIKDGQLSSRDFVDSGYRLGSMVASSAMKVDAETYLESFYLCTMCPMDAKFYDQMWLPMQKKLLSWADTYGTLYVCSGPIFISDDLRTAGAKKTKVPNAFFVCVAQKRQNDMWYGCGMVLPNTCVRESLERCVFPIGAIGELTGIDFFVNLPAFVREDVLSQRDTTPWF